MRDFFLIIDCSGSLQAMGRQDIMRVLVCSVRNFIKANELKCQYWLWRETVEPFGRLDEIAGQGRISVPALCEFIEAQADGSAFMLASDGNWEMAAAKQIKKEVQAKAACLLTIAAGGDANILRLESAGSDGRAWAPMDVQTALAYIAFGREAGI